MDAHGDRELYPTGMSEGHDAQEVVRGSSILARLWWEFATAHYDKVRDGERLARAALSAGGAALKPLTEILRQLAGD